MDSVEMIAGLNEKFSSPSLIFGTYKNSDLPTAFITNQYCSGAVTLFGAHILSYEPKGQKDVLMMSKESPLEVPKALRGGVPLCWPWFGQVKKPGHGIGRIQFWELSAVGHDADGADSLTFHLMVSDPHDLEAILTVTFGAKLTIKLTTVNRGTTDFDLTGALHTYFRVGEITKTTIHGLGGARTENRVSNTEFTAVEGFGFTAETDNIYHSTAAVTIVDAEWNRKILVEKENSRTTVVWNPWIEKSKSMSGFGDEEYHDMVCVEAANCSDDIIKLAPGQSHTLIQKISLI